MGTITLEQYLPKLKAVSEVWRRPLEVTIDSVTAQDDRVVLQARSNGRLYDDQEYANSYLFLVEFDEHLRILHVREYFVPIRFAAFCSPLSSTGWNVPTTSLSAEVRARHADE